MSQQVTIDWPDLPTQAPPIEYWIDDYFDRLTPILKTALQDTYRQWLDRSLETPAEKNPFAMPFEEFEKLSRTEQSEIRRQVFSRNRTWINEQLQKHRAEWIVVVGGIVEKFSSTITDVPRKDALKKMGREKGLTPFLFIREPQIEESAVTLNSQTSWNELAQNNLYPTIGIAIASVDETQPNIETTGIRLAADFDTGSPIIIVRDIDVERIGVNLDDDYEEAWAVHLGKEYRYVTPEVQIAVFSESQGLKSGIFYPRAIYDWATGPFVLINPNRAALVGRNLLLQLGLDVLLKGTERKTMVM